MFEVFNNTETDYELNDLVNFNSVKYSDCRVRSTNGTTFTICTPGRYYVVFNGVASSSVAAAPFSVQLLVNNVAVPAIRTEITSTAADDPQTMTMSTIINVLPSNCYVDKTTNIQVQVTSTDAGTIYNTNLIIFRLK